MKKICIVTTRHVSYNPRVLKEADAFFERGYHVTVVTINNHPQQHRFDCELMQTRKWQLKTINFRREERTEKQYWLYFSLQQKFYSLLSKMSLGYGVAERAAMKGFGALTGLATRQKADFYIAHHAEALPIAYRAAKARGVGFGFDAEDFHTGMSESTTASKDDELIHFLEKKYLPHCSYFSAASKGIGEAYAKKYSLTNIHTILNVFPKEAVQLSSAHQPVRFYWYSQVIGPNRSLETLVEAASQLHGSFELHLRGSLHSNDYEQKLKDLIAQKNLTAKVFFHPPILSENIIKDAARFDVGLALESDVSLNRNICVTNKIFSYLMSGLAIVGTDTYGQKDIFQQFAGAVRLCKQNDATDLAAAMQYFIGQPEQLLAAKRAARKAADDRFNWEVESERMIAGFEKTVGAKRRVMSFSRQKQ